MAGGWRGVCRHCGECALFQRLRADRATFQKVPALAALAPTQSEPPFAITQLIVLLAFLALGYWRWSGFARRLVLWLNSFCEPLFEVFQDDRLTGEDLARGGREIEPGGAIDLGK